MFRAGLLADTGLRHESVTTDGIWIGQNHISIPAQSSRENCAPSPSERALRAGTWRLWCPGRERRAGAASNFQPCKALIAAKSGEMEPRTWEHPVPRVETFEARTLASTVHCPLSTPLAQPPPFSTKQIPSQSYRRDAIFDSRCHQGHQAADHIPVSAAPGVGVGRPVVRNSHVTTSSSYAATVGELAFSYVVIRWALGKRFPFV